MTARKNTLHTDLARADARGVTTQDLAEIPEVSGEEFSRAKPHIGGVEVGRGRPKLADPKEHVNLRLSRRVLDHFRHQGRGWQTRISEILERHVARAASKHVRRSEDV